MKKKIISFGTSLIALLVLGSLTMMWFSKSVEAAWYDESFAYRNALPISSHTSLETNVYIAATIDTSASGQFQADCGDLRFTDSSGNLLQYYIVSGCTTSSTVVHIFLSSFPAGTQTLYYYYGNSSANNGFNAADFATEATNYGVGTVAAQEKSPGPVAYWRFDEGYGTSAYEAMRNNATGTISGATWQTEDQCIIGKCLSFDGSNDVVTVANTVVGVQSVSFWVRPITTSEQFIDLNGSAYIQASSGTISATGFTSPTIYVDGKVSSTIVANKWQHIEVTTGTAISASAIKVAQISTNYGQAFFDEIKLYAYARTAAQVKTDFVSRGSAKGVSAQIGQKDSLSSGLVGYWKMDEASWTSNCSTEEVLDASGNSNNGESCPNGDANDPISGKFGNGGDFDGSNDYVSIDNTSSLDPGTGDLSVSFWAKPDTITGAQTGIAKYVNGSTYWVLEHNDNDTIALEFRDNVCSAQSFTTTDTLTSSVWNFITLTIDRDSQASIYINGNLSKTSTVVTNCQASMTGGTVTIGAHVNYFDGVIDETRIYNRALSPAEVAQLYNWAPGPVGYWDMEKNTTTTTQDVSGNSNTATANAGIATQTFTSDTALGAATTYEYYDIVVNNGVTLTMHGTHNFASVTNNGTIAVTAYDGTGTTGTLNIVANTITSGGTIDGSGRGYGGGGGGGGGPYERDAGAGGAATGGGGGGGSGGCSYSAYTSFTNPGGTATGGGTSGSTGTCANYTSAPNGGAGGAGNASIAGGTANAAHSAFANGGGGGGGGGTYGGVAGNGGKTGNTAPTGGSNGGYLGTNSNSDSSTDFSVELGSGGGGGGGDSDDTSATANGGAGEGSNGGTGGTGSGDAHGCCSRGASAGGGGGGGGASIKLQGYTSVTISGTVKSNGGGGGTTTAAGVSLGGTGGGGGGGGIGINAPTVNLTGSTFSTKGNKLDGTGSTTNGGTLKVFYNSYAGSTLNTTNFPSGRVYTSANTINNLTNPSAVSGKYGSAMNFDGTTSYMAGMSTVANVKTVAFWINPTSTTASILQLSPSAYVTASSGTLSATGFTSPTIYVNGISGGTLTANTWQHVEITTDTSVSAAGIAFGLSNLSFFSGKLDDVKFYTYARTQKQTVEDMNASHPNVGSPVGSAIGHWKFDEGYGTTANNSGNGGSTLNGTLTAGPTWSNAGKFNKAVSFDGSNDYVEVTRNSGIEPAQFTLSAWINPTSLSETYGVIFDKANTAHADPYYDYHLRLESATSISFAAVVGGYSAGDVVTASGLSLTNTWTHIIATYDGDYMRIYVNGLEKANKQNTGSVTYHATNLFIGSFRNLTTGNFNGLIDEAKVYSYPLTADEVKIDYNRGGALVLGSLSDNSTYQKTAANQEYCVPGDTTSCAAPVGEWKFDENTGTSANDTSGNGNSGTVSNPFWSPGKVGASLQTKQDTNIQQVTTITDPASGILDFSDSQNFTAEVWVKFTSVENTWVIPLNKGGSGASTAGYDIELKISQAGCDYGDGNGSGLDSAINSAVTLNDGNWHHIACVMDRTGTATGTAGYHVFVDGVLKASDTSLTEGSAASNTNNLVIGELSTGYEFEGAVDQVRIYDYARTRAQIAWDYNRGGPVGWWKLDECQGTTVYDSSLSRNNGTITIGASGTQTSAGTCTGSANEAWKDGATGKFNYSLDFDGTDDGISITNNTGLSTPSQITLSAWVNTDTTTYPSGHRMIFNPGNAATYLSLSTSAGNSSPAMNSPFVSMYINGVQKTVNFGFTTTTDQWLHVVATYDGSTIRTYVNGVPKNSLSGLSGTVNVASTYYIGKYFSAGYEFSGQLDDVRIYNYALTATQIKQLYNGGAAVRFGPVTGAP